MEYKRHQPKYVNPLPWDLHLGNEDKETRNQKQKKDYQKSSHMLTLLGSSKA